MRPGGHFLAACVAAKTVSIIFRCAQEIIRNAFEELLSSHESKQI